MPAAATPEGRALARAVKALRVEKELTQEELSSRAGLGIHYVSQLERGYHSATFVSVAKLAVALDVPFAELVTLYERHRLRDGR